MEKTHKKGPSVWLVTRYMQGKTPEIVWFARTELLAQEFIDNYQGEGTLIIEKGDTSWMRFLAEWDIYWRKQAMELTFANI